MSVKETHLTGTPASVTKYVQEEKGLHQSRTGEQYTTGYYSENDRAPSRWMGKGAERQGLSGAVSEKDLERALSGITTSGEDISKRGGHDKERRMGSDWTFSAPKIASILAIDDPRIKEWMMESVQETIEEYFEPEMVYARVGKGGAVSEFTENVMMAAHLHETARGADGTIDPQIHVHGVTPSMIQRADGQWVAARYDYGENNQKVYTLGDIQVGKLMKKMQEKGGYDLEARLEKDKDGREHLSFGAKGISKEAEETFSGRKKQINEHLKSLGIDPKTATRAQKDAAALNTRAAKDKNVDSVDLKYQQRERAREAGVDLAQMRANADKRVEQRINAPEAAQQAKITGEDVLKSAIQHLSEREDVFTRSSLISEAVKAGAGDVDYKDILKAIGDRAGGLVRAADFDRDGTGKIEEQFTTKAAILRENEILHRAREGRGRVEAIMPLHDVVKNEVNNDVSFSQEEIENGKRSYSNAGTGPGSKIGSAEEAGSLSGDSLRGLSESRLDAHEIGEDPNLLQSHAGADRSRDSNLRRSIDAGRIADILKAQEVKQGFGFSDGQKIAVALALTSSDRHLATTGAAGAGKTTAMKVVVEQFREAGYEVIGVAPTAQAARELTSAGCDKTVTLASALLEKRDREDTGKRLYLMDEGGMVSSKDMDAFIKKVDREANARDFIIGDPYQIESVASGTPMAQMMETGAVDYVKIDEVQRQRANPELLKLAQAYASGDAKTGSELLKPYITQVQVEKGQDKDEALSAVAADRFLNMTKAQRENTFFVTDTNKKRHTINDLIHDGLVNEGAIGKRAVTITALDKLDMSQEAATRAEKYVPGKEDQGGDVVIEMNVAYKNKDENIEMPKGSQWLVKNIDGGRLALENRENSEQVVTVNPADIKATAYITREMELRDGDKVYFRKNDRERGLINGTQGVVKLDENGKPTVITAPGEAVKLHEKKAEAMDYSYARTVHSVQGGTKQKSVPVLTAGGSASARLTYVAVTRETHELEVITDDSDKLCKQVSKYVDRQTALDASKADLMTNSEELKTARTEADRSLGHAGDFAKKRAAAQAGPTLGDTAAVPDALDPDLGSDKFTEKVEAAMDKIQGKQRAASNAESEVLNAPSPTRDDEKGAPQQQVEPVHETPPPPPPETEMERELGE
jgi:conjugative relaxase-like TrwC/TraI family protein